jgi:hypothetical protein
VKIGGRHLFAVDPSLNGEGEIGREWDKIDSAFQLERIEQVESRVATLENVIMALVGIAALAAYLYLEQNRKGLPDGL